LKKILITAGIFVAVAISSVSIIAMADSSTHISTTKITTPSTIVETKATHMEQVTADKTSEMIQAFNQNSYFGSQKVEFKEMTEPVKLDKNTAIEKAKGIVGKTNSLEAKNITTFLAKYTNKEAPQLPGSKIILKDYPVWVVTFEGVNVQGNGPKHNVTPVYADTHVFIDADTGEMLELISHSSLNN
jgi:hypothetical protein